MARRLKRSALALLAVYLAAMALLSWRQRDLMYFPRTVNASAADSGFSRAETITLETSDHEHIVSWFRRAAPGQPTIVYFHGNASVLAHMAPRLNALSVKGIGLLAIDYRGYGGSTGSPTEEGLLLDGDAAYVHLLAEGILPKDIIVYGESLGTGVAVAVAARHHPGALILEAPYSSTLDVAQARYWMFPLALLMRDTFRSDLRIKDVQAPLLILHGENDATVPIRFGERLFSLAAEPKTFIRVPGTGHLVLMDPGMAGAVGDWIARTRRAEPK